MQVGVDRSEGDYDDDTVTVVAVVGSENGRPERNFHKSTFENVLGPETYMNIS